MEKKYMNIHRCLELFSSAIKGYTRYILIFNTKFFFVNWKKTWSDYIQTRPSYFTHIRSHKKCSTVSLNQFHGILLCILHLI